jgi:hypothetical protein
MRREITKEELDAEAARDLEEQRQVHILTDYPDSKEAKKIRGDSAGKVGNDAAF